MLLPAVPPPTGAISLLWHDERLVRGKLHREHLAPDARGQTGRKFERDATLNRGDRCIDELLFRLIVAGDVDGGRSR